MSASTPPPVTPWHRRVLDWLGVENTHADPAPPELCSGERFPWEPVPPAPRPPQWGAANEPALLLGLDESDTALPGGAPSPTPAPTPSPTPSPHHGMAV